MRTLAEIDKELETVQKALESVLSGGVSYTLDTGAAKQSVTRASLKELRIYQQSLQTERAKVVAILSCSNIFSTV